MSVISLLRTLARRDPARAAASALRWFHAQSLDRLARYLSELSALETTMSNLNVDVSATEPVVTMTRIFNAPRALVWKVMTEREHIARWWGARTFTARVVVVEHDLRVGGRWKFESHGHDGKVFVFLGEFLDIAAPERVVQTFGMEFMFEGKTIIETMALEDLGDGRTLYTNISKFDSDQDRDGMVASGMAVGAKESLEQLAEILAELQS